MQKYFYISFPVIAIVLAALQLFSWYYDKTYTKAEINEFFEPITSKYELTIVYEIREDFFSPLENSPIPTGPSRNSNVKPIYHRTLVRYPEILQKAFARYPDHVIKNYLNAIHFAREIDQDGFKYGGSYDPFRRVVYLVNIGWQRADDATATFHHEFNSIILAKNSFYLNPWIDQHPDEFQYFSEIYDDWEAMKEARKAIKNSDCYEKGIVTNYGLTNFGNDFCEYSAMIFTYPKKFKEIMNQYPRVRGKFKIWLDFYQKIDPIFTEGYLFGTNVK